MRIEREREVGETGRRDSTGLHDPPLSCGKRYLVSEYTRSSQDNLLYLEKVGLIAPHQKESGGQHSRLS